MHSEDREIDKNTIPNSAARRVLVCVCYSNDFISFFLQYNNNVSDIFCGIGRCAFLYLYSVVYNIAKIHQHKEGAG